MATPQLEDLSRCQLYCWSSALGSRTALWLQTEWWPELAACHACRQQWDELCERNPRCVQFRHWLPLPHVEQLAP